MRAKFWLTHRLTMDLVEFCNIKEEKIVEMLTSMKAGLSMDSHKEWAEKFTKMAQSMKANLDLGLKMVKEKETVLFNTRKMSLKKCTFKKKEPSTLVSFLKSIEKMNFKQLNPSFHYIDFILLFSFIMKFKY